MNYRIPVPPSSVAWLFALIVMVPSIGAIVLLTVLGQPVRLAIFLITAFAVIAAVATAGCGMKGEGTVSIGPQTVLASAASYRFEAKRNDVVADGVKRLLSLSEVRVHYRKNGIGLPGYRVGWFSVTVGGERRQAFLLVTTSPILLIPLRSGELLLLSCPAERSQEALSVLASPRATIQGALEPRAT
ncbi:MAG: hypothetical protein WBE92_04115 [Steroidobacteraceae bacterium]